MHVIAIVAGLALMTIVGTAAITPADELQGSTEESPTSCLEDGFCCIHIWPPDFHPNHCRIIRP